jgi:hypothetical protein
MPILADDDVIMHRDPERRRNLHDRLRHLDIGDRRRRIAGRMIVDRPTVLSTALMSLHF